MLNSGRKRKTDRRFVAQQGLTAYEPRGKYLLWRKVGHDVEYVRLEIVDTKRVYHGETDKARATQFSRKRATQLADRCNREAKGCGSFATFGVVTYS